MNKGSDSREFFEIFKKSQDEDTIQKKEVKSQTVPVEVSPQPGSPVVENNQIVKPSIIADPLGWIKSTRKDITLGQGKPEIQAEPSAVETSSKSEWIPRKDEVVLRQETLIIGVIAATFLSIACFFVGHKVGYNKGVAFQEKGGEEERWLETMESQDTKKTSFAQPKPVDSPQKTAITPVPPKIEKPAELPKPIIKDTWTLRVVSYKNTKENIEKAKEIARVIHDKLGYNAFVVNSGKELFICVGEFEANDGADLMRVQKTLSAFTYENKKQFEGCYPVRIR